MFGRLQAGLKGLQRGFKGLEGGFEGFSVVEGA